MSVNTSHTPSILIKVVVLVASLFMAACQTADTNETKVGKSLSTSNLPVLEVIGVYGEKDGDSVSLISLDGKMRYKTIISIPNLGDNYVSLKTGDRVQIAGEYAESYPVQIFANNITKVTNIDKEKCESTKGNEWKPQGISHIPMCISHYSDAGISCKSSSECEGKCMVTDQSGEGKCAASSSPFGCGSSIEEFNQHGGILCVD